MKDEVEKLGADRFGGPIYDIAQALWFGGYCAGTKEQNKTQYKSMQRPEGIIAIKDLIQKAQVEAVRAELEYVRMNILTALDEPAMSRLNDRLANLKEDGEIK